MKRLNKFINGISKLYKRYYPASVFIAVGLAVAVSLWQLPQLYFWGDDWDLFLKVIHPNLSIWGTGEGPFGTGPYRYFHTTFWLLYPIFKLNASAYYIFGIFLYFVTALSLYLLVIQLSGKKYLALSAALVFSVAGIVGAQATEHLQHLYAMMGIILFTVLTIWSLIRYSRTRKIRWYLLSLFLAAFASEYFILRAHGLFFIIVFSTLVFYKWKKSAKHISTAILKLIPFFLIFNHQYGLVYNSGQTSFGSFLSNISTREAFGYFINFTGVFSNILVPDIITKSLYEFVLNHVTIVKPEVILIFIFSILEIWMIRKTKFKIFLSFFLILFNVLFALYSRWAIAQPLLWTYTDFEAFTAVFGEGLMLSILLLVILSWKKKNIESRLILFGIFWYFSEYIGYFIASPQYSFLGTTQRYLAPSLVATSIIISGVLFQKGINKINTFVFSIILIVFCYFINSDIAKVINAVSIPSKTFYDDIRSQIKSLPKNPVILLDYYHDPQIMGMGANTYPNTGFAIFYDAPDRVPFANFPDLLQMIKNKKINAENIISLYVDSKGRVLNTTPVVYQQLKVLHDAKPIENSTWVSTTGELRSDLSFLTSPFTLNVSSGTLGVSPTITAKVKGSSASPLLLTLEVSATPKDFSLTDFPYTDVSQKVVGKVVKDDLDGIVLEENKECKNRSFYLEMQNQHDNFLDTSLITASTDWRTNVVENLYDGKNDTDWDANVLKWDEIHREELVVDLGIAKNVDRLIWVNHFSRSTPSTYSISSSLDKKNWKEIKKVVNGSSKGDSEVVAELFPKEEYARYIKMDIKETFAKLAPSLREMWVDSIRDKNTNWDSLQQIVNFPFSCPITFQDEVNQILNALSYRSNAKLAWATNATPYYTSENMLDWNIIPDGLVHTYEFYLPAQGTKLEEVKISDFQVPVNMQIYKSSLRSLTFDEIDALGKIPSSK